MAPGWILVSKSLEQPLQSRLRYNLPAQEAVSSCHIAVTLWSWGKNPWHDLWALLTTPHLPETQNCCLLPGMRGPSSQHHSGTPRAEQPRQQPRHPTTTSTAAAIRAADGPEGARGVQSLLCLQQEGRPWKESIAALSVPWNPSHCCLMPRLKPGSLEAHLYEPLYMFTLREFSAISALRLSCTIMSFIKTSTSCAYVFSMSQCSLQSYSWKSQGASLHLCT